MSGRLDSNQRPPEPHSEVSRPENRKSKPLHGLQISHFPYSTLRNSYSPRNPPSFLQFPALRNVEEKVSPQLRQERKIKNAKSEVVRFVLRLEAQ
jgi:hypothetical protein